VTTGDYQFQTLPEGVGTAKSITGKVADGADGEFWIPLRRTKYTGTVVQSFDDFLAVWSEVLLMPIVNQVDRRPIDDAFFVMLASKAIVPISEPLTADQVTEVVKRFSEQTGLKLTKSARQIPVVRVTLSAAQ
jgi:hypothetical protein